MRDELERAHVVFQRDESDVAYMIDGLVEIYEVMFRDFVVYGVPDSVGTPEHVDERFKDLTEEQRAALIGFFAGRPGWRDRTRARASEELDRVGVDGKEDNVDIARKVSFEANWLPQWSIGGGSSILPRCGPLWE